MIAKISPPPPLPPRVFYAASPSRKDDALSTDFPIRYPIFVGIKWKRNGGGFWKAFM